MNKFSYADIIKAKEIMQLPTLITAKLIKTRYRELAQKYHPDKCGQNEECAAKFREVKKANEIIMHFLDNYRFKIDKDSIIKYNPAAMDDERYKNDWNWGKIKE